MMHIGQFWLQFRKALLYERISTIKTMSGRPLRGRRGHRGTGSRRFGAGSRRGDVQEGRGDRVGRPKSGSMRQDARGLPAAARHQRSAHNWPRTPQSPVFAKQPTKEGPGPKRFPGVFTSCISLSFVREARSGFYRALGATAGTWRKAPNLILGRARKTPAQEDPHKTTGAPAFCTRALLAPHSGACVLAARPPSATPKPAMRPLTLRACRRRAHAAIAPAPALRGRLGRRSRSARGGAQEARPYEVGRQASLPRARACGALTSCAAAFSATSACAASSFSSWRGKVQAGRPRDRQGSPQHRSRHDS